MSDVSFDLHTLLPGYNCGSCGFRQCRDFAAQIKDPEDLVKCPFLSRDIFAEKRERLSLLLSTAPCTEERITGVIDNVDADLVLAPLKGECSCRELIHPFDANASAQIGDLVRYRPLACPITHFGRVIDLAAGIYTIHIVGPIHRLGVEGITFKELGLCMILAFEGKISRGKLPKIGQTVKFIPEYCMMQKVHSGVLVSSEGKDVRIEAIDLKVW